MSWFRRLWDRDSAQNEEPLLGAVRFDTTGLRVVQQTPGRIEWKDADGDGVFATVERGVTWLPGAFGIDALRAQHRAQATTGGRGIVSVDVVAVMGLPVMQVIVKSLEKPAYMYEGSLIVPLDNARLTLTHRAREHGTTGVREAVVTGVLLQHGHLAVPTGSPGPDGSVRMQGWFFDPYDAALDDGAEATLADDERLDAIFGNHPLTKVRQWLRTITASLAIDDAARSSTVGSGWTTSDPASRLSAQVPVDAYALLALTAERPDVAETLLASAITLKDGEPLDRSAAGAQHLMLLGFAREMQTKLELARWAFDRSHQAFVSASGGRDLQAARAACNAARMRVALGELQDAEPLLESALSVFEEHDSARDQGVAMNEVGRIAAQRGEHRGAVGSFHAAIGHFERAEARQQTIIPDRAIVLRNLAASLQELGDRSGAGAARAAAKAVEAAVAAKRS
jgi:tetratricopeptide (TPR) repeat protein